MNRTERPAHTNGKPALLPAVFALLALALSSCVSIEFDPAAYSSAERQLKADIGQKTSLSDLQRELATKYRVQLLARSDVYYTLSETDGDGHPPFYGRMGEPTEATHQLQVVLNESAYVLGGVTAAFWGTLLFGESGELLEYWVSHAVSRPTENAGGSH